MSKIAVLVCIVGALFTSAAYADITFTYTTTGVTLTGMGYTPCNGCQSTYDELDLIGITNKTITIPLGQSVIAPLNAAIFTVGPNCPAPASPNCNNQSGEITRDLTIHSNGTQSIVNLWSIWISSADTLTIQQGNPVFFDIGGTTIQVTPLGAVFGPNGGGALQGELYGRFSVPEPGVVTLLGAMLAGLGGLTGVLKKKLV